MGYGDEIMAAGHAERVYHDNPTRPVAICDAYGQPRWHPLWEGHPMIATPTQVHNGVPVSRIHNAAGCRPYIRYPFTHQTGLHFTDWRARDHRGRVYLTDDERAWAQRWREAIGPFLLIEPSPKRHTNPNKAWNWTRWIDLAAAYKDRPCVQMLHPDSNPLPGAVHLQVPVFRAGVALMEASDGFVGTEGGLHHAAAACRKPAVVLFGGCMSPNTTGYEDHANLVDDGPGSPCGRWLPCSHCHAAMARITVDDVLEAMSYHWTAAAA